MKNTRFANEVHQWIVEICKSIESTNTKCLECMTQECDMNALDAINKFNQTTRITPQRLYDILSWDNDIRIDLNVYSKYDNFSSIDEKDWIITNRCFLHTPYDEVSSILSRYIEEYIPTNPTNPY